MAFRFGVFVDEFYDNVPTVFINFINGNINLIFAKSSSCYNAMLPALFTYCLIRLKTMV